MKSRRRRPKRDREDVERFEPETFGPMPSYEHVHRYVLAALAVAKLRVLDLASGAGHGTRLLRAVGARVVALDLDPASARLATPSACAAAERLPFRDDSFDAVVCYEAIEHCADPGIVVDEIVRVLAPSGFALISTPDRAVYTDRAGHRNPHHVGEMDRREFAELLAQRFPRVALYGQSVWAGSWLARLGPDGEAPDPGSRRVRSLVEPASVAEVAARPAPWVDPAEASFPAPLFLIAACARSDAAVRRIERRWGAESVLHDSAQRLLGHYLGSLGGLAERDEEIRSQAKHAANLAGLLAERDEALTGIRSHAHNLETALGERESRLARVTTHAANVERLEEEVKARAASLEVHARNLERLLAEGEEHRAGLTEHVGNLEGLVRALRERNQRLEAHTANLDGVLAERDGRRAGLSEHVANLEQLAEQLRERKDGLEAHARNLEQLLEERETERAGPRRHADNLERLAGELRERNEGLEVHARNLESLLAEREEHRAGLLEHTANLEAFAAELRDRNDGLEAHARNLEQLLAGRGAERQHAANLETLAGELQEQNEGLGAHARNLEVLLAERESHRAGLLEHAANLETLAGELREQNGGLGAHARNLEVLLAERESHRAGLLEHAANLEAHLAESEAHRAGLLEHAGHLERLAEARRRQIEREEARASKLEERLLDRDQRIVASEADRMQLQTDLEALRDSAAKLQEELDRIRSNRWYRLLARAQLIPRS